MATASPRESVLGAGAGGPLTAPTPWIQHPGYIFYPGGVVVGNPSGLNKGNGAINAQAFYIDGVLLNLGNYLPKSGGILTGILTLSGDPVALYDAAPKKYVDNSITTVNGTFANYLPKSGGTLTGSLTLSADPSTALQAATKQYVDAASSGFTFPDAPSDSNVYGRRNAAWVNAQIIDVGTF